MSYLIDTDWMISFFNGRASTVQLMGTLADEGVALSIITYAEIYDGLLSRPGSAARLRQLDEFIETMPMILLDTQIARQYARIRSNLRSRGALIPDNDVWIAATARAHGLTLVTRDEHFARVPDLQLYRE